MLIRTFSYQSDLKEVLSYLSDNNVVLYPHYPAQIIILRLHSLRLVRNVLISRVLISNLLLIFSLIL